MPWFSTSYSSQTCKTPKTTALFWSINRVALERHHHRRMKKDLRLTIIKILPPAILKRTRCKPSQRQFSNRTEGIPSSFPNFQALPRKAGGVFSGVERPSSGQMRIGAAHQRILSHQIPIMNATRNKWLKGREWLNTSRHHRNHWRERESRRHVDCSKDYRVAYFMISAEIMTKLPILTVRIIK